MLRTHARLLVLTASVRSVEDPQPAPSGVAAPTDLVAVAVATNQIDLTWTSNSGTLTVFHIRRGLGPGPGSTEPLDDVFGNGTSYSDISVAPGTQYFYTVWAEEMGDASATAGPVTATTPSVGTSLLPDFYSPASSVVQGEDYDLRARVLNPDNTIHTAYNESDWDFTIAGGGSLASIGGPNNDVLTVNPGTAPGSITIEASYVGPETLSPTTDSIELDIVTAPPAFPNNELPGFTQITLVDGSTLSPSDWSGQQGWPDATRHFVVSDPESKHGSVIEKQFFVGDESGWNGGLLVHPRTLWQELFIRIVFKFSSNWDHHSGGEKFCLGNDSGFTGMSIKDRNGTPYVDVTLQGYPASLRLWVPINPGAPTQTSPPTNLAGNPDFPKLPKDQYHTFEYWRRRSTAGNADGALRFWLNDVEYTRFGAIGSWSNPELWDTSLTSVEWQTSDSLTSRIEMPMYWGGQNDTKTQNDFIRISEFYISGLGPL